MTRLAYAAGTANSVRSQYEQRKGLSAGISRLAADFVVGEGAGEGIEILSVVGIGKSFVGDESADDGTGDEGGVPFGVVEAGDRDSFRLSRELAGGFESPVAVKKYRSGGRIIAIAICGERGAEDERKRKNERGAKPGHKQASLSER